MITAGIDAGSRTIKVVVWDTDREKIVTSGISAQGIEQNILATQLLDSVLADASLNRSMVSRIVATGYGRNTVSCADTTITEITCHAKGVVKVIPDVRTIVEIGGQDNKLIRLDDDGKVRDFVMNDRCAAGTGSFLEVLAAKLDMDIRSLGELALESTSPSVISSMCVVFAETEIIGLLASGVKPEDIVAGVQCAIASKITSIAGRGIDDPTVLTGGVALVPGMAHFLELAIGHSVTISPDPQMTGALGGALFAAESARRTR